MPPTLLSLLPCGTAAPPAHVPQHTVSSFLKRISTSDFLAQTLQRLPHPRTGSLTCSWP